MLQGVIFSSCDKQMSTNLLHRWDDEGGCDSIAVGFSILTRVILSPPYGFRDKCHVNIFFQG